MHAGVCKSGIGQDSHRFVEEGSDKPLRLGGITVSGCRGLSGNSDADAVLHAVTNAVSGVSGVNILGETTDRMCLEQGITDSREYLKKALETLPPETDIVHLSISIECKTPKLAGYITEMKKGVSSVIGIDTADIGITATSGEGLTPYGKGMGIQAFAVVSAVVSD